MTIRQLASKFSSLSLVVIIRRPWMVQERFAERTRKPSKDLLLWSILAHNLFPEFEAETAGSLSF